MECHEYKIMTELYGTVSSFGNDGWTDVSHFILASDTAKYDFVIIKPEKLYIKSISNLHSFSESDTALSYSQVEVAN